MWWLRLGRMKNNIFTSVTLEKFKYQIRLLNYDGWYHHPTSKPLIPDTTAVILGWAGSSPKNVQKYTQFYASEFGIGAHGYILPMEIYFSYDLKKISQISKELVQQLAKQHSGKRILFHFFSNNGLGMYKPLTTILKYQPYGFQTLGCVIDSAPSPLGMGALKLWKSPKDHNITVVFPVTFLLYYYMYFEVTLRKASIISAISKTFTIAPMTIRNYKYYGKNEWGGIYLRNIENEDWPLLFLYSIKDPFMKYYYIDQIIQAKKSQNPSRIILSKKFDNSAHVAHFRKYPQEYIKKLESILYAAHFQEEMLSLSLNQNKSKF